MGITGIIAFRNFARNLSPLVMLATLSFFYTVQAQAGEVSLACHGSTSSWVAGYQPYYGLTSGSYTGNVDAGNKTSYTPRPPRSRATASPTLGTAPLTVTFTDTSMRGRPVPSL